MHDLAAGIGLRSPVGKGNHRGLCLRHGSRDDHRPGHHRHPGITGKHIFTRPFHRKSGRQGNLGTSPAAVKSAEEADGIGDHHHLPGGDHAVLRPGRGQDDLGSEDLRRTVNHQGLSGNGIGDEHQGVGIIVVGILQQCRPRGAGKDRRTDIAAAHAAQHIQVKRAAGQVIHKRQIERIFTAGRAPAEAEEGVVDGQFHPDAVRHHRSLPGVAHRDVHRHILLAGGISAARHHIHIQAGPAHGIEVGNLAQGVGHQCRGIAVNIRRGRDEAYRQHVRPLRRLGRPDTHRIHPAGGNLTGQVCRRTESGRQFHLHFIEGIRHGAGSPEIVDRDAQIKILVGAQNAIDGAGGSKQAGCQAEAAARHDRDRQRCLLHDLAAGIGLHTPVGKGDQRRLGQRHSGRSDHRPGNHCHIAGGGQIVNQRSVYRKSGGQPNGSAAAIVNKSAGKANGIRNHEALPGGNDAVLRPGRRENRQAGEDQGGAVNRDGHPADAVGSDAHRQAGIQIQRQLGEDD